MKSSSTGIVLILFSHGSLLCGSGEALEKHADALQRDSRYDRVLIGYLNYSSPSFLDSVREAAEHGAKRIIIAPYFLNAGYFVTHSLPRALKEAEKLYPQIEFEIAPPLGPNRRLQDAVLLSASQAAAPDEWNKPLMRAQSACRLNPECPLYGTEGCPESLEKLQESAIRA